jgi:hypothetical protein
MRGGLMIPSQRVQFDQLVGQLWDGEMGDVEFTEVALDMGASLSAIHEALMEVREEDGTL